MSVLDSKLHVFMASSEIDPFAKSGGLGDVLGSLPDALQRIGLRVSLVMPAYRSVLQGDYTIEDTGVRLTVPVSGHREEGILLKTKTKSDIPLYLIRADRYFDRDQLYGTPDNDYADNAERFTFFSRAVLEVVKLDPPQILHAHDWQSALSVVFLKTQSYLYPQISSTKTVFTIHNLGYQGVFWYQDWHLLNLDSIYFTSRYLEFYNKINFLKGGTVFADAISTVSPTYAEEIKTKEYGFGLEGVFQEQSEKLTGILNGADYDVWNPETDTLIAEKYSLNNPGGKKACKSELQRKFHLPENPDIPVLGIVSRLAVQKGFDLLEKSCNKLISRNLQFILLGSGDSRYQKFFSRMAKKYPDKVSVKIDFNETLAHQVIAGSDMFLMPSRYEPSGLTQIYSLRYGTVPLVRATGGLKDTVEEFNSATGQGTGFVFGDYKAENLLATVDRALDCFLQHRGQWNIIMKNGMRADLSWNCSAQAYRDLYLNTIRNNV